MSQRRTTPLRESQRDSSYQPRVARFSQPWAECFNRVAGARRHSHVSGENTRLDAFHPHIPSKSPLFNGFPRQFRVHNTVSDPFDSDIRCDCPFSDALNSDSTETNPLFDALNSDMRENCPFSVALNSDITDAPGISDPFYSDIT